MSPPLLITLCRAKGLPAKYVELSDQQWLQGTDSRQVKSHVVAEIKIGVADWYFVDPIYCNISAKLPSGAVVYDKGLDSWDIGITAENWRKKFLEFRKLWQQKKGGG